MQLEIRSRGFTLSEPLRNHCERRLGFALGRFADQLGRVVVRLSDVNGPRGGRDKRCHVLVHVLHGRTVSVESVDGILYAAVDNAAERAGHSVSRELARARLTSPEAA